MRKKRVTKKDGRYLIYYYFDGALPEAGEEQSGEVGEGRPLGAGELRWNPTLREWVVTATHRQERTFFPPADYCPLCPTLPGGFETEIPAADYQLAVFENKFPTLQREPPRPSLAGNALHPVRPAQGICEVVCYTPRHQGTLTDCSEEEVRNLVAVWTDRYRELGARPDIDYVFIFENKGEAIGVTLHHPHGQIYGFSFIPPIPERELAAAHDHRERTGRCLFCDILADELRDGRRLVAENEHFAAFVPFYGRWPYEIHLYARQHRPSLHDLNQAESDALTRLLRVVMRKYDNLWPEVPSMPYMMVMHQQPTDGREHGGHFHVEFYPPHRTAAKLKYRASCESGAGTFINDSLPEDKAAELRQAQPNTEGFISGQGNSG